MTGGTLKPAKYYWYLINFQWQHGEWSYKIAADSECNILGDKRTGHIILSLSVKEPKQIMEVWQNLMGDNTRQIDDIIEKK